MYIISAASPQDIIAITSLAYETLPERYSPNLFIQLYESYPEGYLVAKIGSHLIGFLISIRTNQTHARILMLGIQKGSRRKGIASALLRQYLVTAAVHNIKIIDLEVRTTNHAAINFYQRMGFTIQEIIKGFYQKEIDAYTMRLWLKTY